jgi:hypothetical protein
MERERIRMAVTVMAYPAISGRYGESVCVAGLRTDSLMQTEWVRLFPFKGRDLPGGLRISKWDETELDVHRPRSDHRPESFTPNLDSIQVVGALTTKGGWRMRRSLVDLLPVYDSMVEVERRQEQDQLSLAAVTTGQVLDLDITPRSTAELDELRRKAETDAAQGNLFAIDDPKVPLEPIPYDFHFIVRYPDQAEPRRLKIIDWEINQVWRRWRYVYDDVLDRIRSKWVDEICGPTRSPLFFVGNMHRFPQQFLLLNVYSPPA